MLEIAAPVPEDLLPAGGQPASVDGTLAQGQGVRLLAAALGRRNGHRVRQPARFRARSSAAGCAGAGRQLRQRE